MSDAPTKNVLFISIDDLNDWTNGLGGYSGAVHTPHLDSLMASGTTFANAFSQAAICNPSRTSILTGKTPNETGVFQNQTSWEGRIDPADTLFGVMKDAGYHSVGVGKLFHTGPDESVAGEMFDEFQFMGQTFTRVERDGLPAGPYDGEEKLRDEVRADFIADFLENYEPVEGKPLLLSAGMLKPHTDWVVPREFFDLYPLDEIRIDAIPDDVDDLSRFIRENAGITSPWGHDAIDSVAEWKGLIQAYLATISFMDAQIGKMLNALDNSAIAENTTVMLWSDHGYHLGDKDVWHKFTLWDNAARAPLIVRDPDFGEPGQVVEDVVELLDIFPTLLDLVGVDAPDGLELSGDSLRPYLEGLRPEGEAVAYTWMYGNVSIRTNEFRYSLYEDGSEELYDVRADPELERNLAGRRDMAETKAELRAKLEAEFNLKGYGDDARLVTGSDGDDVFADDGSRGAFAGGAGDDIYFVDDDKTLIERAGEGRDLIVTKASRFEIPEHFEDVEVKGFSNLVLGNDADNTITANAWAVDARAGDDVFYGGVRDQIARLGAGDDYADGKSGDDRLFGGGGDDTLRGAVGRDGLFGEDGDDVLMGGVGGDALWGGRGADTILALSGDEAAIGPGRPDRDEAGDVADPTEEDPGRDRLFGGGGSDLLIGAGEGDLMRGGHGRDTLAGRGGDDRMHGDERADFMEGGFGDDRMSGGKGRDRLFGQGGDDRLSGGARADRLDGGVGDDVLIGGAGRDQFIFRLGGGTDVVRDYRDGVDRIRIENGADEFADLSIESGEGGAVVRFGNVVILLDGVDAASLDASDFIF